MFTAHSTVDGTLGKRVSENYRNLSEFWRQIAEQLFCDRYRGILGATSSQFADFVAIHTKSKILIGLELLIVSFKMDNYTGIQISPHWESKWQENLSFLSFLTPGVEFDKKRQEVNLQVELDKI